MYVTVERLNITQNPYQHLSKLAPFQAERMEFANLETELAEKGYELQPVSDELQTAFGSVVMYNLLVNAVQVGQIGVTK